MNDLFKALSHPVRRRIVDMLRKGPLTSGQITEAFDLSWPTVTGHLNALKAANLVTPERHGTSMRYRLEISAVEEGLAFMLSVLESARGLAKETEEARDERQTHPPR
jgi:DNA-binding transcriptional ArsR family regulator